MNETMDRWLIIDGPPEGCSPGGFPAKTPQSPSINTAIGFSNWIESAIQFLFYCQPPLAS